MAGRPEEISDESILQLIAAADKEYISTREIAERAPIKKRAMHNRLRKLEGRGLIQSLVVGNTLGWALTHDGKILITKPSEGNEG